MKFNIRKPGANTPLCLGVDWANVCLVNSRNPRTGKSIRLRTAESAHPGQRGFTLIELVTVLVLLGIGAAILTPALSTTTTNSMSLACKNNQRRLTTAWRLWTDENSGYLLYCGYSSANPAPANRPYWVTGYLDFSANPSNYDVKYDLGKSPVWPLVGSFAAFKCPSDRSVVRRPPVMLPRVRSYSMSQVFGTGEWLDKTYNPSQTVWRTYARASEIALPARTFLFMDVHPDSINDSAFKSACTGSLAGDPPTAAQLIDYPSPLHDGGCNLSFANGRAEAHQWQGAKIRNVPVLYNGAMPLNVPADSSWVDTQWLAGNTTVKR